MLITDVWNNSIVLLCYSGRDIEIKDMLLVYATTDYTVVEVNKYSELSDEFDVYKFAVKKHLVYYEIYHGGEHFELSIESFYNRLVN